DLEQCVVVAGAGGEHFDAGDTGRQAIGGELGRRRCDLGQSERERRAMGESVADLDGNTRLAEPDDCAEHVSQATSGFAGLVLVEEPLPEADKGLAELGHESVGDLTYGLRLARELAEVVTVADRALAEAHPRVPDAVVGTDDLDCVRTDVSRQLKPGPGAWHRVPATLDAYERARRDVDEVGCRRAERSRRQLEEVISLLGEALGDREAAMIALRLGLAVETLEEILADRFEVRARGDGDEMLPADRPPSTLHAALVVARAGAGEARLEGIVRGQSLHAHGELALRADQDAHDGCPQIVVEQAVRHTGEVRERPHVAVEEADLVLARVEPGEVPPGAHQAYDE